MSLFAFFTVGVLAGRPVTGAFEMHIPLSPCSAATQHEFLSITREIDNWNCRLLRTQSWALDVGRWAFFFFRRPNNRPHRNLYDFVRAATSAHFFPHPMAAVFCLNQGLVEKIGEIIDVPVRTQNHVTAT